MGNGVSFWQGCPDENSCIEPKNDNVNMFTVFKKSISGSITESITESIGGHI